jgi:hypothetical protein
VARLATGRTSTRRRLAFTALVVTGVAASGLAACARPRSAESFCAQLGTVRDLDQVLAGGDAPRTAELAGQLSELRQVAPEELDPSIGRLSNVTDDLARTMGTTPDADAAASEVFTRRRAELPEITAAGRTIESYAAEHCRVVLNPTDTVPPTTVAPPPPPTKAPTTTRAPSTTRRPATSRPRAATTTTRVRKATSTTRRSPATTTTRRR